jgi:hypothetical protein
VLAVVRSKSRHRSCNKREEKQKDEEQKMKKRNEDPRGKKEEKSRSTQEISQTGPVDQLTQPNAR